MLIQYKNKRLEKVVVFINFLSAAIVTGSFVALFGFVEPLINLRVLYLIQTSLLCVFILEKIIRLLNSVSTKEFCQANWFEIPLLIALFISVVGAGRWFGETNPAAVRHVAVGIYLVLQVLSKVCRTVVNKAASGRNPTKVLIMSFLVLIICGAGLLMLPRSSTGENIGFIDALFTSTSATCVTGLIVKDTGGDFSLMGQLIILSMIQLGGLGIVVFGAVFAVLLGQTFSVRESVAMQDLLSARTLGRIENMIAFIFIGTIVIEAVGAVSIFSMWDNSPSWAGSTQEQWFCSIFHSISAFCNAGFSLFNNNFVDYHRSWGLYTVICPLIILGGLGFGVLYDLFTLAVDRVKRFFRRRFDKHNRFSSEMPKKMRLQTKIVLSVSALLIVLGMLAMVVFEQNTAGGTGKSLGAGEAFFQSVTARTAGFNTVDISALPGPNKLVLMVLMFIGGSPGSTAGGIKTVTLAVIVMVVITALRKRQEVEMFKRSVRLAVVGRAITVTMLFVVVLLVATLALSITESSNNFALSDISFEAASALGTVGLTTGITGSLTAAGKLIIIVVMLIGRLGPLTLLAVLTFNLKPARYNYPSEAIIVG